MPLLACQFLHKNTLRFYTNWMTWLSYVWQITFFHNLYKHILGCVRLFFLSMRVSACQPDANIFRDIPKSPKSQKLTNQSIFGMKSPKWQPWTLQQNTDRAHEVAYSYNLNRVCLNRSGHHLRKDDIYQNKAADFLWKPWYQSVVTTWRYSVVNELKFVL